MTSGKRARRRARAVSRDLIFFTTLLRHGTRRILNLRRETYTQRCIRASRISFVFLFFFIFSRVLSPVFRRAARIGNLRDDFNSFPRQRKGGNSGYRCLVVAVCCLRENAEMSTGVWNGTVKYNDGVERKGRSEYGENYRDGIQRWDMV